MWSDGHVSIVILTGMPGAGKSTVGRLVAAALPRAARLAADELNGMIVSGAVWPLGQPAAEADRQVQLGYRNLGALAENFTDAGFDVVVDCVVPDRAHLGRLVACLPHRPTELVVLAPGPATCRARNASREPGERFGFDGYDELDRTMRAGFGDQGWWLDTAALTAEATAEMIVAGLDRGRGSAG